MNTKKLKIPAVFFLIPLFMGTAFAGDKPRTEAVVVSSLALKVSDREGVSNALVEKARSLGGYFKSLSTKSAEFRIPVENAGKFLEFAEKQGTIVERAYETTNTGFDLLRKEATLKSREEIREQYLGVLKKAKTKTILVVEKEIAGQIKEIETLKGEIRCMKHRLRFAEIEIAFDFRERAAPAPDGKSSFPWLNTLNLPDLVEEFQYARR